MDQDLSQDPGACRSDLVFFGRIMASLSHELNNVITVVSELSGLLEDLAVMADRGRPLSSEKLRRIAGKTCQQVVRAKELIGHMNRFAHAVDEPTVKLDLREPVDNLLALTRRLLENREVSLSLTAPDSDLAVTVDPFALRLAVFTCLELALQSSSVSSLVMELSGADDEVCVVLSGLEPDDSPASRDGWRELQAAMHRIGGRAERVLSQSSCTVRLLVPRRPDRSGS